MNKIKNILKNKRGASLIIVMAIMLLLLVIGVSVITAASATIATSKAQTESENVHRYLSEVARAFDEDISATKFFNADGSEMTAEEKSKPWYLLARYVYERKYEATANNITIEIKDFDIRTSDNFWASEKSETNKTNITAKITKQELSKRIVYMPEERAAILDDKGAPVLGGDGKETYEVVRQEILEENDLRVELNVRFEAVYEGKKYSLAGKYILDGTIKRCLGEAESGACSVSEGVKCNPSVMNGEFSMGTWKLDGYTKG